MKRVKVQIKGNGKGLLMNNPLHMIESIRTDLKPSKGRRETEILSPEDDAKRLAYWTKNKKGKQELYVPSEAIFRSLINASSFYKIKKKSAKTSIAGAVRIEPDKIGLGTDKYDVDIRTVVIQKARVVKGRANIKQWNLEFDLVYNDKMIPDPSIIREILEEAGERMGILDFRPQKGGQFGTFEVTKWLPQK